MTPAPQFGLSTIGQIGITVHDVERAVAFYRDQVGLRFLFRAPNAAFFDCDGIRLMLGQDQPESFSSVIYYRVDDIHSATEALKTRGVIFEREPHLVARMADHHLWMAFFRDPDGNTLGLMSEMKRP